MNAIVGASPGVTLTNVDNTISGAGHLGDWKTTLVNEGTIAATGSHSLIIDTGSNMVINSGTLEATGSGGLIVNSDILNSGLIWADGGNITINGAVAGNGGAVISGAATLEFAATSSTNVTFEGDNFGTLVLDNPTVYTGQIFGFAGTSPQNSDLIDLKGIAFDADMSWTYSDNAGSDTGGTLTLFETVNGTTSVIDSIAFANGDYTVANFILTSDGSDGTLIADPPADPGAPIIDSATQAPVLAGSTLTGGTGGDTFVFKTIADSQPGAGHFDTITNFAHGLDHIDLTSIASADHVQGLVAEANTVGAHSISWFADTAHNQTIIYVNTTGITNNIDMEIHLTGSNINLSNAADILHHA